MARAPFNVLVEDSRLGGRSEMIERFVEWSGVINVASGVALLAFWYLYAALLPYRKLSTTLSILVDNRFWLPVNILG